MSLRKKVNDKILNINRTLAVRKFRRKKKKPYWALVAGRTSKSI